MKSTQKQMAYGLEASPSPGVLIVLASQHVLVAIVDLTIPVLVVTAIGGSPAQTTWMVQMSMVAIALGTLLQIQKRGIGAGYLIPHSTTAIFLAPSLLAAQSGGIAMVAGMTAMAGVFQIGFARLAQRLRKLFPIHISGLVLIISGYVLLHAAVPRLFGYSGSTGHIDWRMAVVGTATLAIMAGLLLEGRGRLQLYGLAIGLTSGYLLSWVFNVDGDQMWAAVNSAPAFALPKWQHPGFDVDGALLCPFIIAALTVSMKGSGLIAKGHQINRVSAFNDRNQRLGAGLLADGAGTLLSGLLGGFGTSMSAANVGLSVASGATSRRVGYGVAVIFLLLVFFPKVTAVLSFMPPPVMGATMICIGTHLMGVGIQLIRMTPLSRINILTVGLPLLVGLWVEFGPPLPATFPPWIGIMLTSSISATTLLAFCLYWVFSVSNLAGTLGSYCFSRVKATFSSSHNRHDQRVCVSLQTSSDEIHRNECLNLDLLMMAWDRFPNREVCKQVKTFMGRCKMDKQSLMNLVNKASEDKLKIDAVRQLGPCIDDTEVLDVLCREAIETDSHRVREALIKTLKGNPDEANRRFSHIASCAKAPTHRRWALINLSLMECRNAHEAVMKGLRDPHRLVRIAAAFNAGLYCDSDVFNALELFFERNRPLLVLDGVCQAVKPFFPLMKKLGRLYSEYYHHDDTKIRGEQREHYENINSVLE